MVSWISRLHTILKSACAYYECPAIGSSDTWFTPLVKTVGGSVIKTCSFPLDARDFSSSLLGPQGGFTIVYVLNLEAC
jgi:hypothetical protein